MHLPALTAVNLLSLITHTSLFDLFSNLIFPFSLIFETTNSYDLLLFTNNVLLLLISSNLISCGILRTFTIILEIISLYIKFPGFIIVILDCPA